MDHFAGLDVSVKETSVCIVDETGKIVREMKLASEPDALVAVLKNPSYRFKRIGLEAGLPQIQVRRGGVWADVLQVSIGRDRLETAEYHAVEMR